MSAKSVFAKVSRSLKALQRSGQPVSISKASLLFGGTALFGGTVYFSYRYARAHAELPDPDPDPGGAGPAPDVAASFRVFDQLADKYDDAIGQEEAAMWYGTMRKSLLKEAAGDVLEVSVGTGRNFPYYNLDSGAIRSLTCTDLSQHMLLKAEDKFFDELRLGGRHPAVRVTFCLADAHCLVDKNAPRPAPPAAAAAAAAPASQPAVQPAPAAAPPGPAAAA